MLCTSNGSPYLNWQTRIMYRTFQKVQPGSDMLHFTRLLHRRSDDELMAEVPTVRVDSLHAACDKWWNSPSRTALTPCASGSRRTTAAGASGSS